MKETGDFRVYNDYELIYLIRMNIDEAKDISHVGLAKDADLFLVAPATANTIAKTFVFIGFPFLSSGM